MRKILTLSPLLLLLAGCESVQSTFNPQGPAAHRIASTARPRYNRRGETPADGRGVDCGAMLGTVDMLTFPFWIWQSPGRRNGARGTRCLPAAGP